MKNKVWDIEEGECLRSIGTTKENWRMNIYNDKMMTLMEGRCNSEGMQFQLWRIMLRV